jgi:hypothetical protein
MSGHHAEICDLADIQESLRAITRVVYEMSRVEAILTRAVLHAGLFYHATANKGSMLNYTSRIKRRTAGRVDSLSQPPPFDVDDGVNVPNNV